MRRCLSWLGARSRSTVLLTGLGASIPVLVAAVRAIHGGWTPLGDEATIAARAFDVLSSHPPLLGQFSIAPGGGGRAAHSLGPLEYWLLAIPSHIHVTWAPAAFMTLANVACVCGVVAIAQRLGGRWLSLASGAAVALTLRSLEPGTFHSLFNPSAGLLPLTLLAFCAVGLALGHFRLLPLSILLASFAAQCHLTYVLPGLGLLALGLAGLATCPRERRRGMRPWVVATLVLGLVCWSGPLVDEVIHRPGNVEVVVGGAFSHEAKLGIAAGWKTVAHAYGLAPWWLGRAEGAFRIKSDVTGPLDPARSVTAALVLLGLVAAVVLGLRRARRDIALVALMPLILAIALGANASSTPIRQELTISYTLRWGAFAGMAGWILLGWCALRLWRPEFSARAAPGLAVPAIVALVGFAVALEAAPDRLHADYPRLKAAEHAVVVAMKGSGTVRVDARGGTTVADYDFPLALVAALRRDGHPVQIDNFDILLGASYRARGVAPRQVRIGAAPRGGRPGPTVLADFHLANGDQRVVVTATSPVAGR